MSSSAGKWMMSGRLDHDNLCFNDLLEGKLRMSHQLPSAIWIPNLYHRT